MTSRAVVAHYGWEGGKALASCRQQCAVYAGDMATINADGFLARRQVCDATLWWCCPHGNALPATSQQGTTRSDSLEEASPVHGQH